MRQLVLLISLSWLALGGSAHADFSISKKPTQNVSCNAGVCTPTAVDAVLNVDDLTNLLASGDVTVESSDDLNTPGGIDIVAAVRWSSNTRLTLSARHNIFVKAPVTVAGRGALTIAYGTYNPDSDLLFQKSGKIRFSHLESQLVINDQTYVLVNSVSSLSAAVAANPSGYFALADDYDAAGDGTYRNAPVYELDGVLNGLGNSILNLMLFINGNWSAVSPVVKNHGVIRDLSFGNVAIEGPNKRSSVAGLVQQNFGTVSHCYVSGVIEGVAVSIGGLIDYNEGTVFASSVSARVNGRVYAGGLVAVQGGSGKVIQSYVTGDALAKNFAGGLVAYNYGQVVDSYSTGQVGKSSINGAGGLVGEVHGGSISTSYSTGLVRGTKAGGLIGVDATSNNTAAYWDLDTSGVNDPHQGAGNVSDDKGLTGLTDAQLKSGLPDGFDPKIWASDPNINNGYPYLLANPPR